MLLRNEFDNVKNIENEDKYDENFSSDDDSIGGIEMSSTRISNNDEYILYQHYFIVVLII